jgi:RNA polymerase sigma-70 factor, ECF subfamily
VLAESDPTSLDALLTPILGVTYGYALRLLRNPSDAEDLLQEAALAAVRGFAGFQRGTNFKAWFFQILTNCFYGRHRRQKREGEPTELDDVPELYLFERTTELGFHGGSDPAREVLSRLDSEQIAAALERLPDEYRVVSTLYFMEDFTYEQIAAIVGVPVGTVRSRLHRGRKLLQRELWPIAVEHGIVGRSRA